MVEHAAQREILNKARFLVGGARYSQLLIREMENDLFNYHLQQLVKNGLLEKREGKYFLSGAGKSLVTNIDEEDLNVPPVFKVSVYIVPVVDGKVLLCRRRKQPQYGYAGFISEKIKYGEGILEAAERGLAEETGLTAVFTLAGNLRQVRRDGAGKVIEDGIFYVCVTDRVEGELKPGPEGEYFWVEISGMGEVEELFRPSVEMVLESVIADPKRFFVYDVYPEKEMY